MAGLTQTIGALSFPLTDTGESTLASLDPGRDILLDLMTAAINYELGDRWTDAIAGTSVSDAAYPVVSTLPSEPDEQALTTFGGKLPILCCFDSYDGTTVEEYAIDELIVNRKLELHYILAPSTLGSRRKVLDIFAAITRVVAGVVQVGGHTAYATDDTYTDQAKIVLGSIGTGVAGFHRISISEVAAGTVAGATDQTKYHVLVIKFDVQELGTQDNPSDVADYDGFSAVTTEDFDGGLGITDADETTIQDFVEAATDHDGSGDGQSS